MAVLHYRDLIVWQKAIDFAVAIYQLTSRFPKEEGWGLTHQMRRAAASVASNIAEGQGRQSTREFLKFLFTARGSLQEVETYLTIACRVRYVEEKQATQLLEQSAEIGRLLQGLKRSLLRADSPPLP